MIDHLVLALAESQCGVFARFQIVELGAYDSLIRRRLQSGRWVRLAPGVYGLPGHRDSWPRRLWVAVLAAGADAAVSHESAGTEYRVPGIPPELLTVTVPHPQHQKVAGVVVHQTRWLPRHHWINLYGRRTTTLARTLVDLAPSMTKVRLDAAYEYAILTEHLTHARMAQCFRELLSGRRGMVKLGEVLDDRGPGHVAAASELERMLFSACALADLVPVRQYVHPGPQVLAGCVDAALVEAKLILEADGRRWHNRLADQRRDRWRDREAARVGWQTMRFCHEELSSDPVGEARAIREVYDQRVALLAPR